MSFFSSSTYKPQVRVEGFHLPSPGTPPGSSGANNAVASNGTNGNGGGGNLNDLFPHSFLPDAFRKFPPPAGSGEGNHDFNDDLVSLIGDRGGPAQPSGGNGNGNGTSASDGTNGGYDDGYHRTHNIFDVSSPIPVGSNHNGGVANGGGHGPGSQPSSLHSPSTSLHDYQHHPPPHFNSTLPALNSSMRYEPPPENNPLTPSSPHTNAPPSSYHVPHGFSRHTPSPIHSQQGPVPVNGRSRSRSRPPSSGNVGPSSLNSGGVGPARTTRTRRGNSISGTSPPPLHGRPHAILIPGGGQRPSHSSHGSLGGGPLSAGGNSSNAWFMGQGGNQNSGDYLPTPESLGSHHPIHSSIPSHHHSHSHSQSGYGPFSLSPPPQSSGNTGSDLSHHLPPLHHMGHSLPKSPMEQHLPHPHTHQHHLSGNGLPKSPLDHSYPSSYGYTNGNGNGGGSPSDASPGSLPSVLGSGLGPTAASSGLAGLSGGGPVGGVTPTGSNYGLGGIGMNMNIGSPPGASVPPPQGIISGSGSTTAASTGDKQAVLANEKRRRRRESHNAVERRRRDNINEKISELATLIPECLLDGSGPPNAKDTGTSVTPPLTEDALVPKANPDGALKQEKDDDSTIAMNSMDNNVVKANKGMILRKSVEYIRYLQQLVTAQGARNRELERELRKFRGSSDSSNSPSSNNGGEGSANPGTSYDLFNMHDALTIDDEDDGLEGDDSMSLGIGGGIDTDSMVLHDEFVSSPTLSTVSSSTAGNADGSVVKGSVTRKGHHKHPSSSSRPKPPRLPSMPEEDMEVDKVGVAGGDAVNGGSGESLSPDSIGAHEPNGHAINGEGEDLERGRTRGVRSANGGLKEEMGEDGVDHSLGGMDDMFGMMNGHHQIHGHHQQQQQQHQGVMGW